MTLTCAGKHALCFALAAAAIAAYADRVYIDEPGLWERTSSFHGTPSAVANVNVQGRQCSRGVVACSPNTLTIGLFGKARNFSAVVGLRDPASPSVVRFKVWREDSLVWESGDISSNSAPVEVFADMSGAQWMKLEMSASRMFWKGWGVWADASLEMEPGARPTDVSGLSRQLGILTPPTPREPRIHAPTVFGVRPGNPILWRIPVTGDMPMDISVDTLGDRRLADVRFDPVARMLMGVVRERGEYPVEIVAKNGRGTDARRVRLVVGDTLALTPPMGWNSWNAFGTEIDGAKVRRTAELMKDLGLVDHGWAYLTIDDGWQLSAKEFGAADRRDANGEVKVNAKFGGDMKGLADYVHGHGLKFGIYSSPGPVTCGGYEGSWMHEFQDAGTYAKWGVDYLKYDYCSYSKVAFGRDSETHTLPYWLMSEALRKCGRDIVHSLCQQGHFNVSEWGRAVGGQCWRTTQDRFDFWNDVLFVMEHHADLWRYAWPGAWNDPDMMLIGKTVFGVRSGFGGTRLTPNEQYTHVSMWAIMCSPMMIGCDLDGIDDFTLSLLVNDEVIEVNQDELGAAAAPIDRDGDVWIWAKPMSDGSIAAAMVNLSPVERAGSLKFGRNGLSGAYRVRDLWRQADEGDFSDEFKCSIPGHATKMLRLRPRTADGNATFDIRENYWKRKIEAHRPLRPPFQ